jgi:hypothetical protein
MKIILKKIKTKNEIRHTEVRDVVEERDNEV